MQSLSLVLRLVEGPGSPELDPRPLWQILPRLGNSETHLAPLSDRRAGTLASRMRSDERVPGSLRLK
jgi:hypothetical protein